MPSSSSPGQGAGAQAPAPSTALLLGGALFYARRGWAVLPAAGMIRDRCSCWHEACTHPSKHPLTRHGLHDATTDEATLRSWWRRWPHANVALRSGELVIIDIDPDAGGWDSLGSLIDAGYAMPRTATVITGGGGAHFYYRRPAASLRNTAGALPGVDHPLPGIDLRAEGGYVIAPPSHHASGRVYRWLEAPQLLAPSPPWLRPAPAPPRRSSPTRPTSPAGLPTPYGQAALERELARLRNSAEGTRNHELNRAAFSLGQLVAIEHLDFSSTVAELVDVALSVGLGEPEARRTAGSGLAAGLASPRFRKT